VGVLGVYAVKRFPSKRYNNAKEKNMGEIFKRISMKNAIYFQGFLLN